MKFSKLRLLGFKSFVEPTDFHIERGLTGVVGPNGCGKSNLVEALRWVMGENSYKNMRASGMDDVIFSGSGTRPSRNTAEVTLFLDNRDRTAPSGFNDADELMVSRRIERESGSVYRINGKEARAKDVQLLFADQSTGARSPSMVGQGRIGELIQAKPQARRALLEEAAGISGLHTRRHEAELRLRAAETNLERLDDVTAELATQIESLKRQSRQASRFKTLSADIRKSEAILLHTRWTQAKTQQGEANSALNIATNLVAERAQAQMNAVKDQAVNANYLPDMRDGEAKAAAILQRLTIAKAQIEEEAERLRARKTDLERRLQQLVSDIAREEQLLSDNEGILSRLSDEEAELKAAGENAIAQEDARREAFHTADTKLKHSEAALLSVTNERAETSALRGQLERARNESASRLERLTAQLEKIADEAEQIQARISGLADPALKRVELEAAEKAQADAESLVSEAERQVAALRQREGETREPVQEARSALGRAETEARTLAKILQAGSQGLFPSVVEQMKVDKGFETALGAALGEDLDSPLDRSAAAYWSDSVFAHETSELPDGATPLSAHVRAPQQLQRRLSQIGIVDEADTAKLAKQLRPGQRLVTIKGALWRWDGFIAGADAPTAAAQRLAQKNRLAELDAEVAAASARLNSVLQAETDAKAALAKSVSAEQQAREAQKEAVRRVTLAREALAAAERAAGELSSRAAVLNEARSRLGTDLAETQRAVKDAEAGLLAAPDLAEVTARLSAVSSEVAHDRGALAEARAAHEGMRREAEARARRLETIATDRASWFARGQNAGAQIATLTGRKTEAAKELAAIEDAPDEIDARRRTLMTQLSEAERLRKEAADRLQSRRKQAARTGSGGH